MATHSKTSTKGKAIILGCSHGGVAIARSLSKKGIDLLVLTFNADESGLKSKYVTEWHLCSHPANEQALCAEIMSYSQEWAGALLIPTGDYFATFLSHNKPVLSQCYHVGVADWVHARIFLEKDETYRLADEAGVPHPHFLQPRSMAELEAHIPQMQLPIMIKPVHSHAFVSEFREKLFINETFEDLRANFQRVLDAEQDVVVMEIIPGSDYKTLETVQMYIDTKGDIAATFCCMKYRQVPPMYGVIRAGTSMPPKSDLVDYGTQLLRAIDYRGYASIEFKRDPRDGVLKLIEVNIRPLRMSNLAISSGMNFPYLQFEDLVHDNQLRIDEYNMDMKYIEFVADIAGFFMMDPERNVSQFMEPYRGKHKAFSYLSWDDPMPFMSEVYGRSKQLVGKAIKRIT